MRGMIDEEDIDRWHRQQENARYEKRIRQLETLNRALAAQVDRMRPVVDSAMRSADYYAQYPNSLNGYEIDLRNKVGTYRRQMAQLAKEGG